MAAKKKSYYVDATNEAGTSGERPEILATSPQKAMDIYRETFGTRFPVLTVTEKLVVDEDPEQATKESSPVN